MRFLTLLIVGWLAVSVVALWMVSLVPVLPSSFLLLVVLLAPSGYALSQVDRIPTKLQLTSRRWSTVLGLGAGSVLIAVWDLRHPAVMLATALLLLPFGRYLWKGVRTGTTRNIVVAFAILAMGYVALWNSNYVVLHLIGLRSTDPVILDLDVRLYS